MTFPGSRLARAKEARPATTRRAMMGLRKGFMRSRGEVRVKLCSTKLMLQANLFRLPSFLRKIFVTVCHARGNDL